MCLFPYVFLKNGQKYMGKPIFMFFTENYLLHDKKCSYKKLLQGNGKISKIITLGNFVIARKASEDFGQN